MTRIERYLKTGIDATQSIEISRFQNSKFVNRNSKNFDNIQYCLWTFCSSRFFRSNFRCLFFTFRVETFLSNNKKSENFFLFLFWKLKTKIGPRFKTPFKTSKLKIFFIVFWKTYHSLLMIIKFLNIKIFMSLESHSKI